MNTAIGLWKLFLENSKIRLQSDMVYRANYIIGTIISLISAIFPALFQYLIFTQTNGFPGWNLHQIILFQGVLLVVNGLRNTLFGDLRGIVQELVYSGGFDRMLLRPYPPIGTILASGFNANNIGTVLIGAIIVGVSWVQLGLSFGVLQLVLLVLSLIAGLVFYVGINIIYCGISLIIVYMGGVWDFFQAILDVSQYPKEIYPRIAQVAFTTIVPFMVVTYIPAQIILNRIDLTIIGAFIAVAVFFTLCVLFWNNALKKYTSAGG